MGVPVVVLAGNSHVSRVGVSLLSNAGFSEFIAHSPKDYIDLAVELAQDHKRLVEVRKKIRLKMQHSSLMDVQEFIRSLEKAYRNMWNSCCLSAS
jgi:predicted O-linked N-acetylglucosamine transferase (SPINDLY family)